MLSSSQKVLVALARGKYDRDSYDNRMDLLKGGKDRIDQITSVVESIFTVLNAVNSDNYYIETAELVASLSGVGAGFYLNNLDNRQEIAEQSVQKFNERLRHQNKTLKKLLKLALGVACAVNLGKALKKRSLSKLIIGGMQLHKYCDWAVPQILDSDLTEKGQRKVVMISAASDFGWILRAASKLNKSKLLAFHSFSYGAVALWKKFAFLRFNSIQSAAYERLKTQNIRHFTGNESLQGVVFSRDTLKATIQSKNLSEDRKKIEALLDEVINSIQVLEPDPNAEFPGGAEFKEERIRTLEYIKNNFRDVRYAGHLDLVRKQIETRKKECINLRSLYNKLEEDWGLHLCPSAILNSSFLNPQQTSSESHKRDEMALPQAQTAIIDRLLLVMQKKKIGYLQYRSLMSTQNLLAQNHHYANAADKEEFFKKFDENYKYSGEKTNDANFDSEKDLSAFQKVKRKAQSWEEKFHGTSVGKALRGSDQNVHDYEMLKEWCSNIFYLQRDLPLNSEKCQLVSEHSSTFGDMYCHPLSFYRDLFKYKIEKNVDQIISEISEEPTGQEETELTSAVDVVLQEIKVKLWQSKPSNAIDNAKSNELQKLEETMRSSNFVDKLKTALFGLGVLEEATT